MTPNAADLLPEPQRLEPRAGRLAVSRLEVDYGIFAEGGLAAAGREALERIGRRLAKPAAAATGRLVLERVGRSRLGDQGYELEIDRRRIRLAAAAPAGVFYGLQTLAQWLAAHPRAELDEAGAGAVSIVDRPDFPARGVLLDISRNKVPTLATLEAVVDRLASWKINQLQLYTEHTFAYPGHEEVWRRASPLAADEILGLDRYCRERHVELVPNQQSFGHFHRWLTHPRYRPLAECPRGVRHPFSRRREPFSLCAVDPRALELLAELYAELLPNFRSRQLNVGCDETFDLGRGRSATAVAARGKGEVYLDFLRSIHALAARHGRRIQFWGDVVLEHPDLVDRLPADVVALDWGYEADHPFAEEAAHFAASGLDFYVCPGTSSWSSFAGRATNALDNLAAAAAAGVRHGAVGYLVTDWGDHGHLQPLPVSWLGFAAGANAGWNAAAAGSRRDWSSLLDRWAFGAPDAGLGTAALELGDAYLATGAAARNGTALFHLLLSPADGLEHPRYRGLSRPGVDAAAERIAAARRRLEGAAAGGAEARLARAELLWVAEALALACEVGRARLAQRRADAAALLDRPLGELAGRLPEIWLARNRPGGLADSLARLTGADARSETQRSAHSS